MAPEQVQFGLDTFGDVNVSDVGVVKSQAQVLRDLVDQGIAADKAGIDSINIGEHHRDDFAASSPEMVLAAIASRTSRIALGTAVTVLSSDDPVRVYGRLQLSTLSRMAGPKLR
jgi:alkanesulfonate monooxygenase SsuD/methylene tetrahydromethanopterin reductase-like flavin-dependent oxidoreductase (luciferase family)